MRKISDELLAAIAKTVQDEDLKLAALRIVGRLATNLDSSEPSSAFTTRKIFQLLRLLHIENESHGNPVEQTAKRQKTSSSPKYRRKIYSQTWVACLKLKMTLSIYKKAMLEMRDVIDRINKPLTLIDFLCDAYRQGGVAAVLALDGLFELITKHNLDYPKFFHQLYAILEPNLFLVAYRVRFVELLHLALSSQYVSAQMVAAFCKRLARIALLTTAPNCLLILAIIYNLLLKHPAVRCLIHRTAASGEVVLNLTDQNPVADAFDATAEPDLSKALDSYLWELTALKVHAHPAVARFVGVFEKPWRQMPYSLTEFLASSNEQLFHSELKRRPKTGVPFEDRPRRNIFSDSELFTQLWSIK